ncbi:MAG: hypothetical protein S4CHLAM123_13020 [Chlamydiales bacterium]|nr:hypothetical protein [Chlamydiales bacterium]
MVQMRRAIVFSALAKICGLIVLPLQLLLISSYFSPSMQGYFYTFQSLLALQIFVEMGLRNVIVYFTAHESSTSNQEKLRAFAHFVFRYFSFGALLLIGALLTLGTYFLSQNQTQEVNWLGPWLAFSVVGGLNLILIPSLALLEGAGRVNEASFIRFFQVSALGLSSCGCIFFGFELWSAAIAQLISLSVTLYLLVSKEGDFFRPFFYKPNSEFSWKKEVLPLQWRLSVSSLAGYFAFSFFNPVVFYFMGPIVAGQVGLTLFLGQGLLNVTSMWLNIYTPQMSTFIARKSYTQLNVLFLRILKLNTLTIAFTSILAWSALLLYPSMKSRFLPTPYIELFLIGNLFTVFSLPFATYMRAHKEEPLLTLSVVLALLTALFALYTAYEHSLLGLGLSYALLNGGCCLWNIALWNRFRTLKDSLFFH